MDYRKRAIEPDVRAALASGKSILLLGPRQTGKTTLLEKLGGDLTISLVQPDTRLQHEKDRGLLRRTVEELHDASRGKRPLVFLDEVQKVPALMDAVQDLIDRKIARFVLTGSSARKLRRGTEINLLPGRVLLFRMDPFSIAEAPEVSLENHLLFGTLPGILPLRTAAEREAALSSYVTAYLEEEVRAEAIVRNLGAFARFLELSAAESGMVVNFRKLSQEIGVAHTTIGAYFGILEDCLIVERIEPLTRSKTRRKLTKSHKYLFFDPGVRRVVAREGDRPPREQWGALFEQAVGLELLRLVRRRTPSLHVRFWRDPDGPEVDWVLESGEGLIPVEVKWTDLPTERDAQSLRVFLREYPQARQSYVVCRTTRRQKLAERVTAIPWRELSTIIER